MRYLYVHKAINQENPIRLTRCSDLQTGRKLITLTKSNRHKTTEIFKCNQVVLHKYVHAVKTNSN